MTSTGMQIQYNFIEAELNHPFSLYPAICLHEAYPTGEGFYIFGEKENSKVLTIGPEGYFYQDNSSEEPKLAMGCALCVVYLPPTNKLRNIPWLPIKINNKVYFSECYTCTLVGSTNLCRCSKAKREFVSTYTLLEIHYAVVECGYKVRILQSLIYLTSEKIFSDFYRCLSAFKLRYEKPSVNQDLQEYLLEVNQSMGFSGTELELTEDNIKPNTSLRTAIKSILNIGVGKFGQNKDKNFVSYIDNSEELNDIMCNPDLDVKQCFMVTDKIIQIVAAKKKETLPPNKSANVLLNAYTTAHGRLYLDKAIRKTLKAGGGLAYCDTDSILGKIVL